MEILHWDLSQLGNLASFYNEKYAANLPFCFPVSRGEFVEGAHHEPASKSDFIDEKLIVGIEDREIVGYIHVGLWKDPHSSYKKDSESIGLVRFFHFQPECRVVGQELLKQAETYFLSSGHRQLALGVYGYLFNQFSVYGFVDTYIHVPALLIANGYNNRSTWLYMLLRDYQVQAPSLPHDQINLRLQHEQGNGDLPNFYATLMREDSEIGEWESQSCGDYCRAKEAQNSFYVDGIDIIEEERGKGLGKLLLTSALYEMQSIGYKNAMLHVTIDTPIAQLLYASIGFRVENTLYEFSKDLNKNSIDG